MEGDALAAMLPLWSYKSELLTPKPEAYHPFLQKVTILAKAINRNKPFCLAYGSPLKPILWRTALQADVWWCDINTEGVAPGYSW